MGAAAYRWGLKGVLPAVLLGFGLAGSVWAHPRWPTRSHCSNISIGLGRNFGTSGERCLTAAVGRYPGAGVSAEASIVSGVASTPAASINCIPCAIFSLTDDGVGVWAALVSACHSDVTH